MIMIKKKRLLALFVLMVMLMGTIGGLGLVTAENGYDEPEIFVRIFREDGVEIDPAADVLFIRDIFRVDFLAEHFNTIESALIPILYSSNRGELLDSNKAEITHNTNVLDILTINDSDFHHMEHLGTYPFFDVANGGGRFRLFLLAGPPGAPTMLRPGGDEVFLFSVYFRAVETGQFNIGFAENFDETSWWGATVLSESEYPYNIFNPTHMHTFEGLLSTVTIVRPESNPPIEVIVIPNEDDPTRATVIVEVEVPGSIVRLYYDETGDTPMYREATANEYGFAVFRDVDMTNTTDDTVWASAQVPNGYESIGRTPGYPAEELEHVVVFIIEDDMIGIINRVSDGDTINNPGPPSAAHIPQGYVFSHWALLGETDEFDWMTPITQDTILVAVLVPGDGPFTVSGQLIGGNVNGLIVTYVITVDGEVYYEGSYTVGADGIYTTSPVPIGGSIVITPPNRSPDWVVNRPNWTFDNMAHDETERNFYFTPADGGAAGPFTITINLNVVGANNAAMANIRDRQIRYYFNNVLQTPVRASSTSGVFIIDNIPAGTVVRFNPPDPLNNHRRVGGNFNETITRNWTVNFEYYLPTTTTIREPGRTTTITIEVPGPPGPMTTITIRGIDQAGNEIYRQMITEVAVGSVQRGYAPDLEGFILNDDPTRTITTVLDGGQNIITFRYRRDVELDDRDHFRYIFGFPDGTIRPESEITREEVATVFFRLLTTDSRNRNRTTTHTFPDVEIGRWSTQQIGTMQRAGILQGDWYYGTFRPGDSITRAEFATIAMRFDAIGLSYAHDFGDIVGHWAERSIAAAANRGWILGYPDGTFRPDQPITRVEAMTLINRVIGRNVDAAGLYWDIVIDWPDLPRYHWGFYQVMEATISHEHERRYGENAVNNVENWLGPFPDVNFGEQLWVWNEALGTYQPAQTV